MTLKLSIATSVQFLQISKVHKPVYIRNKICKSAYRSTENSLKGIYFLALFLGGLEASPFVSFHLARFSLASTFKRQDTPIFTQDLEHLFIDK